MDLHSFAHNGLYLDVDHMKRNVSYCDVIPSDPRNNKFPCGLILFFFRLSVIPDAHVKYCSDLQHERSKLKY